MNKIPIADCLFLQYAKSASVGQDNVDAKPAYFEWELSNPQEARFVTDSFIKDARGKGQIAWLLEPFCIHPENYLETLKHDFDHVLTHNRYFAENYGWLWYPFGGSWIDLEHWKVYKKTANISMIFSEKNTLPGHKLRHEIARKYGDKLDAVFGPDQYVTHLNGLSPFRYSIVIESESSFSFFNEKIIGCFATGTIPIYWGCRDIGIYFDMGGILQIGSIDELPGAIAYADATHYKACLPAVKSNLDLAMNYRVTEDWLYLNYPDLFKGK